MGELLSVVNIVGQGKNDMSGKVELRAKIKGKENIFHTRMFDKVIFIYLYKHVIVCVHRNR